MSPRSRLTRAVLTAGFAGLILWVPADGQSQTAAPPQKARAHVKQLRASSSSEATLDEMFMVSDGAGGRLKVVMGGSMDEEGPVHLYSITDPRTGEYHIIKLGPNHTANANRISGAYKGLGLEISRDELAAALEA